MGYPDPCIALPAGADDDAIDRLCQDRTADLLKWIDDRLNDDAEDPQEYDARRIYDGSVKSVCKIYQEHPTSKFRKVKSNTRRTYMVALKTVEEDCGKRQIRNLSVIDCEKWYDVWRKPALFVDDDGSTYTDGKERIDRAHDCISMFKTALRFCAALHLPSRKDPQCEQLAKELEKWQFERGGAREQELTYAHASAFVRTALELGERGVIPKLRALYMAIGVATQFELLLRQKDVIGERAMNQSDLDKAVNRGAASIVWDNGEIWTGYFTWGNIPGWRWRVKTSKSKYRHAADFDLSKQSMLFPLLERVPFEERAGAVVKGEGGLPVRERSYRKWFREIARAAGIPDDVWNYDSRAGGATEADNAGLPLELISTGLTHDNTGTTLRYIRRRGAKLDALADGRGVAREADKEAKQ